MRQPMAGDLPPAWRRHRHRDGARPACASLRGVWGSSGQTSHPCPPHARSPERSHRRLMGFRCYPGQLDRTGVIPKAGRAALWNVVMPARRCRMPGSCLLLLWHDRVVGMAQGGDGPQRRLPSISIVYSAARGRRRPSRDEGVEVLVLMERVGPEGCERVGIGGVEDHLRADGDQATCSRRRTRSLRYRGRS